MSVNTPANTPIQKSPYRSATRPPHTTDPRVLEIVLIVRIAAIGSSMSCRRRAMRSAPLEFFRRRSSISAGVIA